MGFDRFLAALPFTELLILPKHSLSVSGPRRVSLLWSVTSLLLFLFFLLPADCPADETASRSVLARWRATAFGEARQGLCCWVTGPEGALRLEVSAPQRPGEPARRIGSLLAWEGDGWTLILGEPGQGTLNRWREQWRQPPPGLEPLVRAGLADWSDEEIPTSPGGISNRPGGRPSAWRSPSPELRGRIHLERRWEAPLLSLAPGHGPALIPGFDPDSFRNRMIRRGSGRGGSAEIVTLEFSIPAGGRRAAGPWSPGTRLLVSSSRRPGQLQLDLLDSTFHPDLSVEAFLPLWPLGWFLSPAEMFPGTPYPADGLRQDMKPQTE